MTKCDTRPLWNYLAIKHEILHFVIAWVNVEVIRGRDINQEQKDKYFISLLMVALKKKS